MVWNIRSFFSNMFKSVIEITHSQHRNYLEFMQIKNILFPGMIKLQLILDAILSIANMTVTEDLSLSKRSIQISIQWFPSVNTFISFPYNPLLLFFDLTDEYATLFHYSLRYPRGLSLQNICSLNCVQISILKEIVIKAKGLKNNTE